MSEHKCYKNCGKTSDLRPYGPKGEWVCFNCAFSTPEDKKATEESYKSQLAAAGSVVVVGEETGPRPLGEFFTKDASIAERIKEGKSVSIKEIRSHLSPEEDKAFLDIIKRGPLLG